MADEAFIYNAPDGRRWVIRDGLVYGADAEVATWCNMRLGGGLVAQLFVAIGVLQEGVGPADVTAETLPDVLQAAAYFWGHQNDDDMSDICCAVVSDNIETATPAKIRAVLDYPFGQLKCRRITAEIDLSNDRAVRQAQKLGFKLEGRKRRAAAGGREMGVFGLLPDECPIWSRGVER